ncbi:MAG: MMPL family transporter [Acidisphaera sp.]|nr:MMPL family transporter [Acidisphaera sp.]
MVLQRLLVGVVETTRRHALLTVLAGLLLAAGSLGYTTRHLGVTTDTDQMFATSLPWRARQLAFERDFPQFKNLLVAVVDARIPEEADASAASLAAALAADHAHFQAAWQPGASPFFLRNAFLFLDLKQLTGLLNSTIDAQPFLGQLVADPSARGLFAALSLVAMGVQHGEANLAPFAPALRAFDQALGGAAGGDPRPLSWEDLLAGSLVNQAGRYRFVLAKPVLDYTTLQPGGAATRALRQAAAQLEFVRSGEAHVRVTGAVALSDEEFASVMQGIVIGTVASIVLITLWLVLALRSWRLIVPVVLTLLLGLSLTIGFAAAAVGTLNLVSVAFAILFVGIAVDFAIQYSVRYREARLEHPATGAALALATRRAGIQILVAAAATAAGFYAFVPTAFQGVAELGLIAGTGMVIAFLCALLFLPAALTVFRPPPETAGIGLPGGERLEAALVRHRGPVLSAFAALALGGALLLPRLSFDSDPLHTKDPNTESMGTLYSLMDDPLTNPYTIDIIEPSVAQAVAVADKVRPLPLVADALTLQSFVPQDQPAKLALIGDAANILGPTLAAREPAAPVTADQLRLAIRTALSQIGAALAKLSPDDPLAAIAADLRRLAPMPDPALLAMNAALTRFLPLQIERLRQALSARPVTIDAIPPDVSRDWALPDGRARVQVLARPAARDSRGLHELVREVQAVAPDANGAAVIIVATAATIIGAFRSAAIGALTAIAVILFAALRRPRDVALVMAPLLLSALMTVVAAVALPLVLNFANIIALPLLLGVGVSFNIYFVMNWREGARSFLGTPTARAVVFSALTTGTAFGSLALSRHPGTASMGDLLLLSLGCTLIASLLFVPTLLRGLRN